MGLGIQKRHMHLPGGCGAGVGLFTFSHTVRIVSAYVSHTQTPFCAPSYVFALRYIGVGVSFCTRFAAVRRMMLALEPRFNCEAENQGAVEPRKQPAKLPGDLRAACVRLVSQRFRIVFAYSDVVLRPVGHISCAHMAF